MNPSDFINAKRALGLSQSQMAAALGLTTRHVRRYETGEIVIPYAISELVLNMSRKTDVTAALAGLNQAFEDLNEALKSSPEVIERMNALVEEANKIIEGVKA